MKHRSNPLHIVGISTVTTNELAVQDNSIGKLWAHFLNVDIKELLGDLASTSVFAVYSNYENTYHGHYTVTIGYAVHDANQIPTGLSAVTIPAGNYKKYDAKSNGPQDILAAWQHVWADDAALNRNFIADYEEYHGDNVSIYVGVSP